MASLVAKQPRNRRFTRKHTSKRNTAKEQDDFILNLSSHNLTAPQKRVLNKGLNFVLNENTLPDYEEARTKLTRQLRLQHFFRDTDNIHIKQKTPFKKKSTWNPPPADTETENYLEHMPSKFNAMEQRPLRPNLNKAERAAMKELTRAEIIIKKADKGSCLVVENRSDYINDGLSHLSDSSIYQPIDSDPTKELTKAINTYVSQIHRKGYISNNMKDYLVNDPETIRTQQLYFLKKVHKGPHAVRPIVSGSGGPTEKVSEFMDFFLNPCVQHTYSYLKDSRELCKQLEELTFPPDCTLATVDVVGLYLHIPHMEGVETAIQHLYHPTREEPPFPPQVARELLNIILQHNYFEFNGQMYTQIQGTAMGTKVAPSYANLFMDTLEKEFLTDLQTKPILWKRFIDDILIVWPGPPETLKEEIDKLNQQHPTIKFTAEISETQVTFLDLELYKGNRFQSSGKLDIRPHIKATNKFQYLHYSSAHPRSVFKAVANGELTRMLRASTDEATYNQHAKKITTMMKKRNYPNTILTEALRRNPFSRRPETLVDKTAEETEKPNFIVQYSDIVPTSQLREAIKPEPTSSLQTPRIAYKKGTTLSSILVRARIPRTDKPPVSEQGITLRHSPSFKNPSTPCGAPLCKCCKHMSKKGAIFSHSDTPHQIPPNTDCNSRNIIYLLECSTCNKKYVGQTQRSMKERFAGHRAAHRSNKNMPLYRHFNTRNHNFEESKITILEKVKNTDQIMQKETDWITKLDTRLPKGLNSHFS